MTPKPSIAVDPWKPCDLRGIFPDAVHPDLFRRIGSAIGSMLPPRARVLVAGDFRLSTPALKSALSDGLRQTGAHVIDAGQVPTPLAYLAARRMNTDAVLMVTASHNPPAHNGLKLMLGATPASPAQIAEIRARCEDHALPVGDGDHESADLLHEYRECILARWKHLNGNGRRVVLDAGNGAWSEIAPEIFRSLGFQVACISCVADGNFPDRSPDCSIASNLTRLCGEVSARPGSIGIAWDGDGDRVAFVDEEGEFVSPDEIALLLVEDALKIRKNEGPAAFVVDIKCSDAIRRTIQEQGGAPLLERTGHAFMRRRMMAEQATMGLDACGHYFFHELHGGDDGLFAALFVLGLLQERGESLAEARRSLPRIFCSPEFRIPAVLLSYQDAAKALTSAFPQASVTEIDGLRFVLSDGVVLIRESGTEPVLSLRVEGFDAISHERILSQCLLSLPEAAPQLERALPHAVNR